MFAASLLPSRCLLNISLRWGSSPAIYHQILKRRAGSVWLVDKISVYKRINSTVSTFVLNNLFVTSLEIILKIFTNKKRNKRVKGPLEWNRYMTGLSLHINLWSTAFAAAPVSRNRTQSQISVLWICCGQVASMEAKYNTWELVCSAHVPSHISFLTGRAVNGKAITWISPAVGNMGLWILKWKRWALKDKDYY